jgi:AraC-like DNA-binding protein
MVPVLGTLPGPELGRDVARALALAVPFAFWLAARLYFEDSFRPGPVHVSLLLGLVGARALVLPWPAASSGIAAVAILDALRRIHSGRRSDLLLSRLRLRYVTLLGTGVYALLVVGAEATVARGSDLAAWLAALNDVGLLLVISAASLVVLRVEPDLVRNASRLPASAPATILEKKLEGLIEREQVFREEGLTIGALAERMGEQEYKVRQLINARLGFRNFGAFLNHYRLREACKVLADPGQRHLGVAEIAYRHGYSSLGPFNRAFKEIVGQTPTEYRKAALEKESLADSGTGHPSSKDG